MIVLFGMGGAEGNILVALPRWKMAVKLLNEQVRPPVCTCIKYIVRGIILTCLFL